MIGAGVDHVDVGDALALPTPVMTSPFEDDSG
jgi:hypothetical protein